MNLQNQPKSIIYIIDLKNIIDNYVEDEEINYLFDFIDIKTLIEILLKVTYDDDLDQILIYELRTQGYDYENLDYEYFRTVCDNLLIDVDNLITEYIPNYSDEGWGIVFFDRWLTTTTIALKDDRSMRTNNQDMFL